MYGGGERVPVNRRSFLGAGAGVGAVTALGTAATWSATRSVERVEPDPSDEMAVEVRTVAEGTDRETPLYRLEADEPGPTAMVFGGLHGDEVSGYRAAEKIAEWAIDRGSLVVVPWADVVAIDAHERAGPDGDLNRQFPSGQEPSTELAAGLWDALLEADPDVVFDLHRSRGIYETHAKWVGQVVFPTVASVEDTEAVLEAVNDEVVPRTMPFHRFVLGNALSGTAPLLLHKVAGDLGLPGYIVETTEYLLSLDTQVRWTLEIVKRALERHGVRRVDA